MIKRVTLRTIADDLGITVATASLALRGHPRISAETTQRVEQAAARLGYIYNRSAANLRQTRSNLVAVCLSDLSNPVFNEFLEHIEDELREHQMQVFLGIAREDPAVQRRFLQTALEQGVGGIILLPVRGTTRADLSAVLPEGRPDPLVPMVVVSRALGDVPLPQFVNDDLRAGQLAAQCLIDHGHRRIVWVGGGQQTSTAQNRLLGVQQTLAKAGLPLAETLHGPTSRQFGHQMARALAARDAPPSGVICFSDLIAFGMIAGCQERGKMPGRDISIIGCDDMEEARLTYPPLTTIAVDKAGIGRQAARCLLSPQNGQQIVILPPQLVLRGTVGRAAQPGQAPS
ncbi:LacI family DNA-binding transcriptional regulator [Roseinatronobacter sp. NSM]|uniref:LacI family DNA-binding transcriptional regulator n=1 Tax=Roseinatronobacter sp. NSM TaxID=3457785 RepID=UPI004037036B